MSIPKESYRPMGDGVWLFDRGWTRKLRCCGYAEGECGEPGLFVKYKRGSYKYVIVAENFTGIALCPKCWERLVNAPMKAKAKNARPRG